MPKRVSCKSCGSQPGETDESCAECLLRRRRRERKRAYYRTERGREAMRRRAKARHRSLMDTDPDWRERERARGRARRPASVTTPEKRRARVALGNAIRDGRLVKPGRCSKCHEAVLSQRLHAHHRDYSKPLEVEWICSRCHGREHRAA